MRTLSPRTVDVILAWLLGLAALAMVCWEVTR